MKILLRHTLCKNPRSATGHDMAFGVELQPHTTFHCWSTSSCGARPTTGRWADDNLAASVEATSTRPCCGTPAAPPWQSSSTRTEGCCLYLSRPHSRCEGKGFFFQIRIAPQMRVMSDEPLFLI
jgi:hypothetical protein